MDIPIQNGPHKRKRNENTIHAYWWDKRVSRFFRENFKQKERVNLERVYLALCEIDSDFVEKISKDEYQTKVNSLLSTCSTYAGMSRKTTSKYMQKLRDLGFIEYWRPRNELGILSKYTYLNIIPYNDIEPIHKEHYE